jgi:hypothetical protein
MNPGLRSDPADEVAARLAALEAELGDLHDVVAERLNHLHPPTAAGSTAAAGAAVPNAAPWRVWWWPALDPEQTAAAWQHLEAWVAHALLARHPQHTRVLLGCWPTRASSTS